MTPELVERQRQALITLVMRDVARAPLHLKMSRTATAHTLVETSWDALALVLGTRPAAVDDDAVYIHAHQRWNDTLHAWLCEAWSVCARRSGDTMWREISTTVSGPFPQGFERWTED
jgi:hypothetical protein